MSRVSTKGAIDEYFHIFNRGVEKRDVFIDKQDRLRFYESLRFFNSVDPTTNFLQAKIHASTIKEPLVQVIAYCLLPNHFHLILKQPSVNGIGEFMRRLSTGYTNYFNEKYERSGALFQGPYKRVLITSPEQLQYLLVYVNENHIVHKLKRENDVAASSSLHYQGKMQSKVLTSNSLAESYDINKAQKTAVDIWSQRDNLKKSLLE